ncbi:MAG: diaminopimelate epimerase [Ignavibacteria bacterium]|nr:diaminopimelate epimerase [Ignavibacteria bacterium]
MKLISFTKMTGAGNDFILFDDESIELTPEKIKILCSRNYGIGADGILTIHKSQLVNFKILYYNSDGSGGALCANGARCAVKYLYEKGRIGRKTQFEFVGQIFRAEVLNEHSILQWINPPYSIKLNFKVEAAGQLFNANYVDIGSKHLIIVVDDILINTSYKQSLAKDLTQVDVNSLGKELRYHSDFAPDGLNVNFIQMIDKDQISIRTYERGVEAETLACGSGCVSSAIIAFLVKNLNKPIKVKTFGGEVLQVDFKYDEGKFTNISLIGPAKQVFEGKIDFSTI